MAIFEIPLAPQPQLFSIQLAGVTYNMRLQWNDATTGGWVLDIFDENDVPMVCGMALVTGADLLEQYGYLGFGGALYVQSDFDVDAVPDFTNLGVNSHLYFVTPD
jgi:hypothetical protein